MKVIDISMTLSDGMITYEGDPEFRRTVVKSFARDGFLVSRISMGLHAGTHVDAPLHYLLEGKAVDKLEPGLLVGKARVLDLTRAGGVISEKDLKGCGLKEGMIALLKTRNSLLLKKRGFSKKFTHLSNDAADYLAGKKIRAVGIDYLSIEEFSPKEPYVHKRLLSNGIPILEGLDLRKVKAGCYTLYCLPLKIAGGEAAPARCILVHR